MTTKRYKTLIVEENGVDLADQTEFDLGLSDAVQSMGALITIPTIQAAANNTLQLSNTSNTAQVFTGTTAGQIVILPDATTLAKGFKFELFNQSTQQIVVKTFDGATLFTLSQTSIAYIMLQDNTTDEGGWIAWQVFVSSQASGILNYVVAANTAFTTSSTSDALITGFTVTPQAGTYAVWYNATMVQSNSTAQNWWSIYSGGVQEADSQRNQRSPASNATMPQSTQTTVVVDGTKAIDVRVRTNTGSITINARSMILVRLG